MKPVKLFSIIFIMLLSACSETLQKNDRPTITVSILPQKYLVERITGNNFRVNVLVPPGSSPETYEPTPKQMQDMENSLIYFRIGYIEFEMSLLRNVNSGNEKPVVVNTAEGVDIIAAETIDHGDHVHLYGVDPHIWLSIPEVKVQVNNMLEAILESDPDNKDYYLDNYYKFREDLDNLHAELTNKFSEVKRKTFLIFHPSLGYFARDYGLSQISIEQDGKNPTAANMRKIIDRAREDDLKDVLIQMEFERDNARAIARELGGDVIEINPLSENWLENINRIAYKISKILNK